MRRSHQDPSVFRHMQVAAPAPGIKEHVKPKRRNNFNDKPDVRTHVVDASLFQRQTPPTGFLICTAVGREIIVDSDHAYYSNHSAAVARSKALDLCSAWAVDARKVLPLVPNENDVDLSSEHAKSVGLDQSCEMPRRVLEFCS